MTALLTSLSLVLTGMGGFVSSYFCASYKDPKVDVTVSEKYSESGDLLDLGAVMKQGGSDPKIFSGLTVRTEELPDDPERYLVEWKGSDFQLTAYFPTFSARRNFEAEFSAGTINARRMSCLIL
ncbi:MAG: hypothetical protein NDJ90_09215 [Oligoflexia bacterium]|nr:hypothetical protein [Oligoflexia bacterium]